MKMKLFSNQIKQEVPIDFFDNYSEFYNHGRRPQSKRLNYRYNALIENYKQLISGKRILDIGCHNGRWSLAALKNDAEHVIGVDINQKFLNFANKIMSQYNIPKEKYQFIQGNIFDIIPKIEPNSIDTVFCFGYFYHTMHHMKFLLEIKNLNPNHIIFDTHISELDKPVIEIMKRKNMETEGYPSKSATEIMLNEIGFDNFQYYDWTSQKIKIWEHMNDYRYGRRITFLAENMEK